MNQCVISGHLTRDPELRRTQTGVAVTSFTVAVDRPGESEKTDFIRCYAWRTRAEFIDKYFRKGQRIECCGPITTRSFDKDGEKRTVTELRCDYVNFGERKRDDAAEYGDADASAPVGGEPGDFDMLEDVDTELPF